MIATKTTNYPSRSSSFYYIFFAVLTCACMAAREYVVIERNLKDFVINPFPSEKQLYQTTTSSSDEVNDIQLDTKDSSTEVNTNGSNDNKVDDMETKDSSTDANINESNGNKVDDMETKDSPTDVNTNGSSDNNITVFHTGSFANCTEEIQNEASIDGPESGSVIISCKQVKFRAKLESFNNNIGVIVGVLSSAGGAGPARRQSIRKTWASDRHAVFFLVAGPWEDISKEYAEYGDLLWIDEEEVYDGEKSVLTLKTYSFFAISYAATQKYNYTYTHIFKTDDDSFVSIDALHNELSVKDLGFTRERRNTHDYFGQCQLKYPKVHREEDYKWPIRNETYPEPWFPRYCQGSGFGLSQKFLSCAVGQNHVANVRFMPFEDVAVGMLAERCGVVPEWPSTSKVKVFRYKSDELAKRVRLGDKNRDDVVAPYACMKNKIVQHRIIDDFDMEEHFKAVKDPSYCDITKAKRDKIVEEKTKQGIEFFD